MMTREVAVSDTSASTSVVMSSQAAGILNTSANARRHAPPIGSIARTQPTRPKRRSNDPRELSPVFMPRTSACANGRQEPRTTSASKDVLLKERLPIRVTDDDIVILQRHRISLHSVCFKVGQEPAGAPAQK